MPDPTDTPNTEQPKPLAPHLLPGQDHAADPKAEAAKQPANQLPTSRPPEKKPAIPSYMGLCQESQFSLKEYTVFIPKEHTPDMLAHQNYFMHHARRLQINDKIDCIHEGGRWELTLRVVNKGDTWVKTRLLSFYDAKDRDETATHPREDYEVSHVPSQKWRVVHKLTKALVSSGHPTRDAAIAARDAHVETLLKRQ